MCTIELSKEWIAANALNIIMKVVIDLVVNCRIILYNRKMLLFGLLGRKGLAGLVVGWYPLFCLIKVSIYRLFQQEKH